jgi:hypothetical protein
VRNPDAVIPIQVEAALVQGLHNAVKLPDPLKVSLDSYSEEEMGDEEPCRRVARAVKEGDHLIVYLPRPACPWFMPVLAHRYSAFTRGYSQAY